MTTVGDDEEGKGTTGNDRSLVEREVVKCECAMRSCKGMKLSHRQRVEMNEWVWIN